MSLAAHDVRERPELPPSLAVSWPSKNNCNSRVQRLTPENSDSETEIDQELLEILRRPVSLSDNTLRNEAVQFKEPESGEWTPLSWTDKETPPQDAECQARSVVGLLEEFHRWMKDYQGSKLIFENSEGDTVAGDLENSYMSSYSDTYYAKLKQFERAVQRHFPNPTVVMLTLTASSKNKAGNFRCIADHMTDITDGWYHARQPLYDLLSGLEWEMVRIWEPHDNGYGHMHIGLVIEGTADISATDFAPVMESYVRNCGPAGTEAHRNIACDEHYSGNHWDDAQSGCSDCETPVSVNDSVEDMGCYLAEYLGIYGEGESVLDRSLSEQIFYATSWATNSRRIDFSNGAQELINEQDALETQKDNQRRQERGVSTVSSDSESEKHRSQQPAESATDIAMETIEGSDNAQDWELIALEDSNEDRHPPPEGGPISMSTIDGKAGWDRPKIVD